MQNFLFIFFFTFICQEKRELPFFPNLKKFHAIFNKKRLGYPKCTFFSHVFSTPVAKEEYEMHRSKKSWYMKLRSNKIYLNLIR